MSKLIARLEIFNKTLTTGGNLCGISTLKVFRF